MTNCENQAQAKQPEVSNGDMLGLAIGNTVIDKENKTGARMIVVENHETSAKEKKVSGTGKTVADFNEGYDENSNVVTTVFRKDLYQKVKDVEELSSEELKQAVDDISIREYDYPADRLMHESSIVDETINTYHELFCYQSARIIQVAAGVPNDGFLWKKYNELVNGEIKMASIEKENRYQLQEDFGVCIYCRKKADTTFDHIIPTSKGGSNGIENQVPACLSCNSSKGDTDVIDWCKENNMAMPRIVWGKYIKQQWEKV